MGKSSLAQKKTTLYDADLLSSKGWYYFSQLFLEATYLQPFNPSSKGMQQGKRLKNTTKNGYIEREIHGAMHASRVAWSTVMLHRLCHQQYPEHVQNKIQALMEFSNLSEEDLFCLIRYVGLGHDAAREGEAEDRWENESAACIEFFLQEHGLNPQLAALFSRLASFKDKPQELARYLASHNLDEKIIAAFQYARLLVSLADCFDIIRCNGEFDFAFIELKLTDVFPYSPDKDACVFFDYAKQTLRLIKRQKDLYFPTRLIGPNKESFCLKIGEDDYSLQEKATLEHADYAVAAMLKSINQEPYFQQLLNTETPEYANPYAKEPVFNPFIHGTNSASLALMTQTDFKLMSAIEMLEQYGLAPLSGELRKGGFSTAMANGNPCFAKLNGKDNSSEYSLSKIIDNYTKPDQTQSGEECLKVLRNYTADASKALFSQINIINIYLARTKQLGINLGDITELHSLEKEFQKSLDVFYLYLLFATHIVGKEDIKNLSFQDSHTLGYELTAYLSLPRFLKKLEEANLSIYEIYNNPTAENCQKIIELLTLPERCKVQQLFEYVEEPLTQQRRSRRGLDTQWDYVVRNVSSWCLDSMLYQTLSGWYDRSDFQQLAPELLRYIEILKQRFSVTKRLLQDVQKPLKLSVADTDLVENPLPIILCYEQSRYMRIISMPHQEYRSQKSLKLGEDIQIIATDTEINMKRLKAYSDRHQLNLTVISFADLERARDSLRSEHPLCRQQVVQHTASIANTHNSGMKQQPLTAQSSSNTNVIALNEFCAQQRTRLQHTAALESLTHFQEQAQQIILSDRSAGEKKSQLKACAHHEFEHRHYAPRLLADALMLISSFALIGLAVGVTRILTGHSFFFSAEKTRRETEFIKIADAMELNAKV
ncbi:hypothetical protein [Legionella worsleiensis]|uniref:SidE PDE domain-containing protein n=1 Tax=Legionella worsleiensis TaxID=45076 RepID=A0A0W1AEP7_9GAMM|nr:hypothetical protein [Legionella worsleiensis]KTD79648.1 hypothetical protein Lwor_1162 [Legionella worsleiensis]STY32158.1 Uncharacterised protein [Legionella worsleiensis]